MKWSALQSPLVWSGAVAVITLLGVASIPLSLPAQGESGKVSIATANTGDANTGEESTTISIAQEANANSQNGVPKVSGIAEPPDPLDPFGPGVPQMPDKTTTARTTPVPSKSTAWQVQGPLPGWLDGELDQEEMKLADALRSKLSKTKIDVQFNGIPLAGVLEVISEQIGVDVYADEKSLEGQGVAVDEPVLLHFKNQVSVRNALTLLLSPLGLTYNIRHGMIVVTSRDDEKQSVRTYDLSYILPDSSTVHELMSVIRTSVQPDVWDLGGGTSTLGVFGSMLVVNANELTHHDLERLLRELATKPKSHSTCSPCSRSHVRLDGRYGNGNGRDDWRSDVAGQSDYDRFATRSIHSSSERFSTVGEALLSERRFGPIEEASSELSETDAMSKRDGVASPDTQLKAEHAGQPHVSIPSAARLARVLVLRSIRVSRSAACRSCTKDANGRTLPALGASPSPLPPVPPLPVAPLVPSVPLLPVPLRLPVELGPTPFRLM